MQRFNLNNKTFSLLENSENGKVNSDTVFRYQQEDDLVTAEYDGGTIRYGKIIAQIDQDKLEMLYQCITVDGELKAGKANAQIRVDQNNKIHLHLDWEWLGDSSKKGISEYIEN
ncbi:hypothetical protein [Flagellimonas pacifica]|uniref:N-acetylglutamate synthase n=1 Tax=Flagellimonas pacifica TaxID=1247520 RepID=A0A285MC79_9FLAO|nr:hypothetical protein [Allomuricauda parva]SNY94765.1 hypothetical protein SAMN06265377_0425 [Allomuricauda parva]